jgi:hypothetical protein
MPFLLMRSNNFLPVHRQDFGDKFAANAWARRDGVYCPSVVKNQFALIREIRVKNLLVRAALHEILREQKPGKKNHAGRHIFPSTIGAPFLQKPKPKIPFACFAWSAVKTSVFICVICVQVVKTRSKRGMHCQKAAASLLHQIESKFLVANTTFTKKEYSCGS